MTIKQWAKRRPFFDSRDCDKLGLPAIGNDGNGNIVSLGRWQGGIFELRADIAGIWGTCLFRCQIADFMKVNALMSILVIPFLVAGGATLIGGGEQSRSGRLGIKYLFGLSRNELSTHLCCFSGARIKVEQRFKSSESITPSKDPYQPGPPGHKERDNTGADWATFSAKLRRAALTR